MHGYAGNEAPLKTIIAHYEKCGKPIEAVQRRKRARLASQQLTCQPAQPGPCNTGIANQADFIAAGDGADFAEQVLFQQLRLNHHEACVTLMLGKSGFQYKYSINITLTEY